MKDKRVTINEIAAHAGVSRSTVSLILRGSGRISEPTRQRVQAAISELGYTYNRSAANLRTQSSQAIGLIINDLTNPFFTELTAAIEQTAERRGYFVYLVQSGEDPDHQHKLSLSMVEHGVAGLIICPATGSHPETFERLRTLGIPVCIAVRPWPDDRFDFAGPDNFRAAHMAVDALIEHGHRRIAFLGGERGNPSRDDRLAGYFGALQKHDIGFDETLVIESRPSRTSGIKDVAKVLALADPPSAALCYNDFVAISVMHGLRQHGLQPGQDFALIGFDGMPEAETSFPPLSTVFLDARRVGANAAHMLIGRIDEPDRPVSRSVIVPDLVLRQSHKAS
ncbi:MAG: LacI family DNA-binding transcriptional regulator [Roseitalea sp.]|jgi:LacI family transcriptional regulator|nr:LacI family DNA-binding transcriptional regulator [Roseitalea sp.]MBO6721644.1 LacI family DNA-binding transcriptional regulator [Roseitalea sp.]MBO6743568.1 LacI family DNA-binding transcriptional regulator [Roseitalea sp.]